ncbi:MAG TPA: hypothetical protein VM164_02975 [Burkholderiales bacterium]|nr:hypothetical protein [Burkholderiales bacterium]
MIAAIRVLALHGAAASGIAARTKIGKLGRSHAQACAIWRLVKLTVAAVRQLVAATHEELKPVTFTALVAADVYAADIADDFKISGARLMPPRAIGVEEVPILCGNALHARYLSKDWASHETGPQTFRHETAASAASVEILRAGRAN